MRCQPGDLAYVDSPLAPDCNCYLGRTVVVRKLVMLKNRPFWELNPLWQACGHIRTVEPGWTVLSLVADEVLKPIRGDELVEATIRLKNATLRMKNSTEKLAETMKGPTS